MEAALHRALKIKIKPVNQRREFFRVSLDEIKDVVKNNLIKQCEFVDVLMLISTESPEIDAGEEEHQEWSILDFFRKSKPEEPKQEVLDELINF